MTARNLEVPQISAWVLFYPTSLPPKFQLGLRGHGNELCSPQSGTGEQGWDSEV